MRQLTVQSESVPLQQQQSDQRQLYTVKDLSNVVRWKVRELGYGGNNKFAYAYGHDPSIVCKVISGKIVIPRRLAKMLGFVLVTNKLDKSALFVKSCVGENTDIE